ncbi:MAG TPA: hypothetical protein VLJ42_07210 [Solirubrobacteraceae bacterium]|nr:hypothetical protein [Solirubrobacteraceae bacterium]
MGAITAPALADRLGVSQPSARARLIAAERAGLLQHEQLLARQPALFTVTPAGMRASGLHGLEPCAVSATCVRHLIECAAVAAALEHCYPDHRVDSERELRRDEREQRTQLASARVGIGPDGGWRLHRPDLVLYPAHAPGELPIAVEVELTVKAPRRLREICRGWARCRCVAGVLYLATPPVERALQRALQRTDAHQRITVVPLAALPVRAIERTVPSAS